MAVSAKTLCGYKGKIAILERFCQAVRGGATSERAADIGGNIPPKDKVCLEKELWFLFCEEFAEKSKNGTKSALEAYRSAVAFFQTLGDVEGSWAGDDDVMRASAAARYQGGVKKQTRKRGALTRDMFEELLDWLRKAGEARFVELLTVAFGCHARISEVIGLKACDVEVGGIWIPNKGFRVATMETQEPRILKPASVIADDAWKIIQRRAEERAGRTSALMFPCKEGRVHELRRVMKRACSELSWEEDVLDFSVLHCLRHGRITDLVGEGRGEEVKMAPSTLLRYGSSNGQRRKK